MKVLAKAHGKVLKRETYVGAKTLLKSTRLRGIWKVHGKYVL